MAKKIFVSGCYDVLHGGHVQFFEDAKALGDHLTVSVAGEAVLLRYKGRRPAIPLDNKLALIGALRPVDKVVASSNLDPVFDFRDTILQERPDILAVTEDDRHVAEKRSFCAEHHIELAVLPKRNGLTAVSTTNILARIKDRAQVPLRVDFAGGWLDVPKLARAGGYIVNCAIQPLVSLGNWPYEIGGGLGGSAAKALLEVRSGVQSELALGVGWQDPAVIEETGLCVWRSGATPRLEMKTDPHWLEGKFLLQWTGEPHCTPDLVDLPRDYDGIMEAGRIAMKAVEHRNLEELAEAVRRTYRVQLGEGMKALPELGSLAMKYVGGGHGGYALHLFDGPEGRTAALGPGMRVVEPYMRGLCEAGMEVG
jgi:cytidyltransferase-like protein